MTFGLPFRHRRGFAAMPGRGMALAPMQFLTDFGDEAVVLPLMLAVGLALALGGWRRGAAAWLIGIAVTLTAALLGKLILLGCEPLPMLGLRSPSGHTAAAAVACGGLLGLLAPRGWRTLPLAAGGAAATAALVGLSRLALGAHSLSDVLAGAVLGIAGAVLLARLAGDRPTDLRRVSPVAAALAAALLFHGIHLHAEERIARLSHLFWPLTLCTGDGVRS